MSYRDRVIAAREESMRKLAEQAWKDMLERLAEDGEDLADYDAATIAEDLVDAFRNEGLAWPKPTLEELRELVPELVRYVSHETLGEVAPELPKDILAEAVLKAVPKLSRSNLRTLFSAADAPPSKYWFASEDAQSEYEGDMKPFAMAEAKRRLEEARKA